MGGLSAASSAHASAAGSAWTLSQCQLAEVARLRAIDRQVRAHEQAHLVAAGPYAKGGPSYEYVTGPDHQRYAVGGEVSIDTTPVRGDPEATIQKMLTVIAAANAPADPSIEDRAVAAQASLILAEAQAEMLQRAYSTAEEPPENRSSSGCPYFCGGGRGPRGGRIARR